MCLAGQVLPLLDTRRIGHQVFTVLTLDSFCLLLFHLTKGKKRTQWGSATTEFLKQFRTVGQTLSHRLHTAEERSNSLRCMFQGHSRLFNSPKIPPKKWETPTPLQEQLPPFRTFLTLFLMCHKAFFLTWWQPGVTLQPDLQETHWDSRPQQSET